MAWPLRQRWQALPREIHASYSLPLGRMTGLALRQGMALTIDTDKQALISIDTRTGTIASREKFPNPSLRGFAWGQDSFWSSDSESGFIYRHGPKEPHSLINAFPSTRPVAVLYHDGETLWASDVRSELIHFFSLSDASSEASLTKKGEYSLPGIVAGGFHKAEDVLWVLDSLGRKVRRYRIGEGNKLSPIDSIDLGAWLTPASEIAGFAVDAENLWLITDNPASLHRFALDELVWAKEHPSQ
jgi:hypothetical protein